MIPIKVETQKNSLIYKINLYIIILYIIFQMLHSILKQGVKFSLSSLSIEGVSKIKFHAFIVNHYFNFIHCLRKKKRQLCIQILLGATITFYTIKITAYQLIKSSFCLFKNARFIIKYIMQVLLLHVFTCKTTNTGTYNNCQM